MTWAELFKGLLVAGWSVKDIAEGYGTAEKRVTVLVKLVGYHG